MCTSGIASYNVRGLQNELKRRKFFNLFHEKKHDIICLQETHSVRKNERIWRSEWGGNIIYSHYNSRARKGLNYEILEQKIGSNGRYIILELKCNDVTFVISTVYGPNQDDPEFFVRLFSEIDKFSNPLKLVGGDFNVVLDPSMDRMGTDLDNKVKARKVILEHMADCEMMDLWRQNNPDTNRYTWFRKQPTLAASRIDFWLVSNSMIQYCDGINCPPGFITDHSVILLTVRTIENERGKGVWKFNNNLLEDKEYVKHIEEIIDQTMSENVNHDPRLVWETLKCIVRGETIQYASFKKRSVENKILALEKKLEDIQNQTYDNLAVNIFYDSVENLEQIERIKQDLNEFMDLKTAGAMIRSRTSWMMYGEKMSSFFFQLEKANNKKKTIVRLRVSDGYVTQASEILKHQQQFYKQLYQQREMELTHPPLIMHRLLPDNVRDSIESPLDITEIDKSASQMALNKTPGPDGFSVDFYRKFWVKIRGLLFQVFTSGLQDQKLHKTAYEGIIMLLPKKGRDLLELKNWRPLTLLNNDYKILSKALANRMQNVMEHIICEEQCGFMKGRFIGENILSLQSIIEYLHANDEEGLLITADVEKAFDLIRHEAIWTALTDLNFGEQFIGYVRVLYKESECRVLSNGWLSDSFRILNAVKQGDAISSFLFLCVIQILITLIKNHEGIQAVTIDGVKRLLGLFADDVWNVIRNDIDSIDALLYCYRVFYNCTGLSINYDKTEIMRIGSLRDTDAESYALYKLQWTSGPVKVLGIDVYNDLDLMAENNFVVFREKFTSSLKSWKYRGLSLMGRILIVNTLLVSQLVYKMMMICTMTEAQCKELKDIVLQFLWEGRKAKIAYDKITLPYANGGLQLHDLVVKDKSMKLSWIPKLMAETQFAKYMQSFLPLPSALMFQCNINPKHLRKLKLTNRFVKQILGYWAQINYTVPKNKQQILAQVIWYNSLLDTPFMYNRYLYDAGIVTIRDIFSLEANRFYDIREMSERFGISINFMTWYRIIQSLPHTWKVQLRLPFDENEVHISMFESIENETRISRKMYWHIVELRAPQIQGSNILWNQEFDCVIDPKDWSRICVFPNKLTLCTKLRLFQYKINQRCLVTNINLFYYKIREDKMCTFCKKDFESIMHLLWLCPIVRNFWRQVFELYKHQFNDNRLHFEAEQVGRKILLNRVVSNPLDCINTLVLIAKRYIYVQRCAQKKLSVHAYINKIKEYKVLEEKIAIQKGKQERNSLKWANIVIR